MIVSEFLPPLSTPAPTKSKFLDFHNYHEMIRNKNFDLLTAVNNLIMV